MYAIAEIAGKQYKVEKDKSIYTNKLQEKEGAKVEFDQILLIDDKGKVTIGQPIIKGALVSAKVLSHEKGDKIIVFKKKRRKGYQVKNGHRQDFTKILIEKIQLKADGMSKADAKEKAETKEVQVDKAAAKKIPTKAETKSQAKQSGTKKKVAKKDTKIKT
ncbi:MAG: 50S ribosomal protein L21 [Cytophagales bacterium]|nr:50S ribosomal protein L21 [Cytophagales bacterium]